MFIRLEDAVPESRRFCMLHLPGDAAPVGAVVYVHPFADEMNKARRMAACQARALARSGFAVLQLDLFGCGDSDGEFGDATWDRWVDDVVAAASWLLRRCGEQPGSKGASAPVLLLWGMRVGALVASAAAQRIVPACNLLLWQPVVAGKTALHQFLRLQTAGQRVAGRNGTTTAELRRQLSLGQGIDVAGYRIGPALAEGLESSRLQPPAPPGRVWWYDVAARADAEQAPAARQMLQAWSDAGVSVVTQAVVGPSFWETAEIEDAPALLDVTTAACLHAASPQPVRP